MGVGKMRPKISVIIPVYNSYEFLERCLKSVRFAYTTDKRLYEAIVVNDGSKDYPKEKYQRLCEQYRVKCVTIKHSGVSGARNKGMDLATGKYITFLDADDGLRYNALIIMLSAMDRGENIVQFNQYRYYAEINALRLRYENQQGKYWFHNRPNMWCMVWNKMYNIEFLKANNIRFIEGLQFGEDEIFNLEAIIANKCLWHDSRATVIKHFDNDASICHGLTKELLAKQIGALNELFDKYKKAKDIRGAYEVECLIFEHLNSGLYERIFNGKEA